MTKHIDKLCSLLIVRECLKNGSAFTEGECRVDFYISVDHLAAMTLSTDPHTLALTMSAWHIILHHMMIPQVVRDNLLHELLTQREQKKLLKSFIHFQPFSRDIYYNYVRFLHCNINFS